MVLCGYYMLSRQMVLRLWTADRSLCICLHSTLRLLRHNVTFFLHTSFTKTLNILNPYVDTHAEWRSICTKWYKRYGYKKIHPALLMVRSRNIIMIDRVCNRAHVKSCSRPDWYVECHKHPWTFTYESVSQTMTLFPFALLLCSHSTLNHTNDEKSHNAMFF